MNPARIAIILSLAFITLVGCGAEDPSHGTVSTPAELCHEEMHTNCVQLFACTTAEERAALGAPSDVTTCTSALSDINACASETDADICAAGEVYDPEAGARCVAAQRSASCDAYQNGEWHEACSDVCRPAEEPPSDANPEPTEPTEPIEPIEPTTQPTDEPGEPVSDPAQDETYTFVRITSLEWWLGVDAVVTHTGIHAVDVTSASSNTHRSSRALGNPDAGELFDCEDDAGVADLFDNGEIVLEFARELAVAGGLTVYVPICYDSRLQEQVGRYRVELAPTATGPWTTIGVGTGTQTFDIH